MNLFVDRVRRAPKCFGMQFMAAIWTQDRTHNIVLQVASRRHVTTSQQRIQPRARSHHLHQVNYLGLQLYNMGDSQTLLASFRYLDSLVSWLALNDMLTLHVVHK